MEKNKEFTQIINKYSVNEKLILLHLVYNILMVIMVKEQIVFVKLFLIIYLQEQNI